MNIPEHLRDPVVSFNAKDGSRIEEAARSAIQFACEHSVIVEFVFNDKTYCVQPGLLIGSILNNEHR